MQRSTVRPQRVDGWAGFAWSLEVAQYSPRHFPLSGCASQSVWGCASYTIAIAADGYSSVREHLRDTSVEQHYQSQPDKRKQRGQCSVLGRAQRLLKPRKPTKQEIGEYVGDLENSNHRGIHRRRRAA